MPAATTSLVTGGAGFIGSRLARRLVEAGERVVVADNLSMVGSWELLEGVDAERVHVDLRCPEDLGQLPRGPYERVFHLAASFANARSVDHPEIDRRTNVEGTAHLLAWAARAGCGQLIYTGSSSSYGAGPVPFSEDAAPHPETPYARSKLDAEALVLASPLDTAVFRLFNVYGPGDLPGAYRNAIPNLLDALHRGARPKVFGVAATRDFTYVEDVVDVLVDPAPPIGAVVNVGTGVETRIVDLVAALLRLVDAPADHLDVVAPRAWDRVSRRVADVSRLCERYVRAPSTPLDEGLRATLAWLRETDRLGR